MLLHNVEFDFKATRGADYKRYTHGRKAALAAINALDKEDEDYIIRMCEIMDDFFADLLGENYADRLALDTEDVEPMLQLLNDFNAATEQPTHSTFAAVAPEFPELTAQPVATAPLNRAQRRAARRNAQHHA